MGETERLLIEKGDMAAWAAIALWYADNGADDLLQNVPANRLLPREVAPDPVVVQASLPSPKTDMRGGGDIHKAAQVAAQAASSLDDLRAALQGFEGLDIRKTAMNLVFADGLAGARVMVVGDPPESDEDRMGVPFSGEAGALLDKMFAAIGLSRRADTPAQALYLTHVLAWRPPGNRTPTTLELECSLPFLQRHIVLAKPDIVVVMGNVAAKSLFSATDTVAKLRGKILSLGLGAGAQVPAMVLYAPSFLLRSPLKKKEAWEDLQMLKAYLDGG